MFDNMNNNFNNNFNDSFDNKPLFDNFNTYENINYNQENIQNYKSQDIPPKLDEIKPLNNSTFFEAPTLDVLGPANFIPENIEPSSATKDPLSLYENGNLNFDSDTNFNNSFDNFNNYDISNSTNNLSKDFSSFNGFQNNMDSNDYVPFEDFKNSYQLENIDNQNNTETDFINNFNNNQFDNIDKNTFNNEFENTSSVNKLEPDVVTNSTNFKDYLNSNRHKELNKTYDVNKQLVEEPNDFYNNFNDREKDYVIDNSSSIDSNFINDKDLSNQDEFNHGYEIDNNISLNEQKSLDNLGIDSSYNEPDILEIMDIEEKESKEKDSNYLTKSNTDIINDSVIKIKKLIDEIKTTGVNIEIEEFDFEQMYQLIIKISKNNED